MVLSKMFRFQWSHYYKNNWNFLSCLCNLHLDDSHDCQCRTRSNQNMLFRFLNNRCYKSSWNFQQYSYKSLLYHKGFFDTRWYQCTQRIFSKRSHQHTCNRRLWVTHTACFSLKGSLNRSSYLESRFFRFHKSFVDRNTRSYRHCSSNQHFHDSRS